MTSLQSRREGGFTLLELLLVIGVAALLLIGGIATYRLVSEGNRATEATRLLLTLRQEAQTMAQQQGGTYNGIAYTSTTSAPNNVFVASGILRDQQRNPFNGNITIAASGAATTPADQEVLVTFEGVPRASCVKLATSVSNPNEITSVAITPTGTGGGAATLVGTGTGATAITAVNAGAACGSINTIQWQLK